jgi:elongation factor Ts
MAVTMQQIKELRDRTQAGLNDCKVALSETEGDMEKAVEAILKKGLAKSAKRAGAVAAEGVVVAKVANDNLSGVIVEVNIQTDFAARNPDFNAFVEKVVEAAMVAKAGADLSAEPFPGGEGSIEDNRQALVGRLGENITVRRWERVELGSGLVHAYNHMGGKVGALLAVQTDNVGDAVKKFADDTAMHIAAMAPRFLTPADVVQSEKDSQAAIFDGQLAEEGKPEAVRPKIIEGKLNKWLKEICLLEQASVVDSEKTIKEQLRELSKSIGADVAVAGFFRFERGEGIDKAKDDFAEEAQRMAQQAKG